MLQNKQIGFIGGGAMAEALIRGIIQSNLVQPDKITVSDVSGTRLEYLSNSLSVNVDTNNIAVAEKADILFLCIKPQVIHSVLETISSVISAPQVVVSIAAGICIETLEHYLPGVAIVRVMPNTPVSVGEGMAAISLGSKATAETGELISPIFSSSGRAIVVAETAMDAVTGLSGSGPGYAFVLIDALADAGVRVGLPRQSAITLAAQTLLGAAKMVLETGEHPAKLRDMVTSPGGTTIAGIHVLEQKGVRAAVIDAVIAATNRSIEMGKPNG